MGELKWITITVPVEMTATTKEMGTTFLTGACPRFGAVVAEGQAALVRSEDVAQKIIAAWPSEPTTDYTKRLAEIEVTHAAVAEDDAQNGSVAHADRGWLLAQHRAASSALTVFGVPEDGRSLSERIEDIRSQATLEGEVARLTKRLEALGDNPDNGRQIVCGKCKDVAWNVCTHMANNVGDYQDTRRALTAAGYTDDGRPLAERIATTLGDIDKALAVEVAPAWRGQARSLVRRIEILTNAHDRLGQEAFEMDAAARDAAAALGEPVPRGADHEAVMAALRKGVEATQAALRAAKVLAEDGALGPVAKDILDAATMLKRIALGSTVEHACADPAKCALCQVPTEEEAAAIRERPNEVSDVPTPPAGFAGTRTRTLGEVIDGAHVVRLAEYAFQDGSRVPYVELHETHDGQYPGRVMAVSTIVHLAQNVGAMEAFQIGNREGPPLELDSEPVDVEAIRARHEAAGGDGADTINFIGGDWSDVHDDRGLLLREINRLRALVPHESPLEPWPEPTDEEIAAGHKMLRGMGSKEASIAKLQSMGLDVADGHVKPTDTRPETGPMRFGDDWAGVFLRGDYAGPMAIWLRLAVGPRIATLFNSRIHDLADTLAACDHSGGLAGLQQMRPFGECVDPLAGLTEEQRRHLTALSDPLTRARFNGSTARIVVLDKPVPAERRGAAGMREWLNKHPDLYLDDKPIARSDLARALMISDADMAAIEAGTKSTDAAGWAEIQTALFQLGSNVKPKHIADPMSDPAFAKAMAREEDDAPEETDPSAHDPAAMWSEMAAEEGAAS